MFVPAVVAAPAAEPVVSKHEWPRETGVIELEIDGIVMRVARGADARTVASVIRALKGST